MHQGKLKRWRNSATALMTQWLLIIYLLVLVSKSDGRPDGFFQIDYLNNTFVKDNKPYRYVAGSFHYSRVHPDYWMDRLIKVKAAGLNAIQMYVPWNVHELKQGEFTWTGSSDLPTFLTLAQKLDIAVLLRLGPYICGEWEFGGFPAWLLNKDPDMVFRTNNPSFMKWVTLWYNELLAKVKPFLYNNGGPVIMVQIENEYGSYYACDRNYTAALRNQVGEVLGDTVIIYTTDGGADSYLKCGKVEFVYATVDFGPTLNPSGAFQPLRDYEPRGPFVNSEFYTGWLDHWGSPHSHTDTTTVVKSLDLLLAYGANINMYMFVGGTNFGFYNGANSPPYQPVPTSYDYDAPVSEAGDITMKFLAIRDIVSKYLPLPSQPIPQNSTKGNYGKVPMEFVCTIQDCLDILSPDPVKTTYPVSMEKIEFYLGFIVYRFTLDKDFDQQVMLNISGVRDRAMVMVNGVPFGIADRVKNTSVAITGSRGQNVDILVENQGRIGFSTGINYNLKGIINNVTLDGQVVTDWTMYPIHLDNINKTLLKTSSSSRPLKSADGQLTTPSIYVGDVNALIGSNPMDTFLDPRPWAKGQAFVNNFNLGRYWPVRGPQVTLYIPKPVWLPAPQVNRLFLFEVDSAPCDTYPVTSSCSVTLTDQPYLDGPVDSNYKIDPGLAEKLRDPDAHIVH